MSIGRTSLSLSALSLPSSTYDFGEFFTDGVRWDRLTASSPWVHGRRLRNARMDVRTVTGELYVISPMGTSPATHDAARDALVDALSQFSWTLTITGTEGGSQSWSWTCEPADIETPDSIMSDSMWSWSTLNVSIPVYPIALAGSY